jgi:hypothetical protein
MLHSPFSICRGTDRSGKENNISKFSPFILYLIYTCRYARIENNGCRVYLKIFISGFLSLEISFPSMFLKWDCAPFDYILNSRAEKSLPCLELQFPEHLNLLPFFLRAVSKRVTYVVVSIYTVYCKNTKYGHIYSNLANKYYLDPTVTASHT